MKLVIIDGQSGRMGALIAERVMAAKLPCKVLAVGTNAIATATMRSVLIGSEYPTKDTPHFLLSKLGQRRFHRTAADPGCTGALPCAG